MRILETTIGAALLLGSPGMAGAQEIGQVPLKAWEMPDGRVRAGGRVFASWGAFHASELFEQESLRCATESPKELEALFGLQSDCSSTNTFPAAEYDPAGGVVYEIPVVVHVLQHPNGNGFVSDQQIQNQIDVLNEDFNAIPGTNGASGTDCRIQFTLAGTTRSTSAQWYNDSGAYYNQLSWDTTRYLNIYTNTAGGYLGYAYVPNGGGVVGSSFDRVVIFWRAFGRDTGYAPYDLGRTATHEVGHYLGLYHTFQGGCSSTSGCYNNGDLICDTNPESSPNYSGCARTTCESADPVQNYMDYSEDACMDNFTDDQAHRMRCTLENWRVHLWATGSDPTGACCVDGSGCSIETAADCSALGGAYQGDGTTCSPDPCPPPPDPTGACCLPGGCSVLTASECSIANGTYQGDDTACSPDPCGGGGGDPVDAPVTADQVTQGTLVSGSSVQDLQSSDGFVYSIDADRQGAWYRAQIEVTCTGPFATVTRLDVATEVGASVSAVTVDIEVQNAATGAWVLLGSYSQGVAQTTQSFPDVASPNDYVNAAGDVVVRITARKKQVDYSLDIDHVEVVVSP